MTDKKQQSFEQAVEVDGDQAVSTDPDDEIVEAPAEEVVDDELQQMAKALTKAEEELVMHHDAMLRMQAEMENLRKRLVREQEKARRRTLERMMADLLPVRDSLERGMEAASDPGATVKALREGKQLIVKMLSKVMADHGLQTIDPQGEPFNPEKHEAMTMLPSDQHDENTVIDVLEKGYQLHDRLIRPAKVVVSRKL